MSLPLVGIIANPASGRDIRRLVAHGTVFDNNEKTAIVRRVLLGLEAVGIRRVAYMPEHDFGILPRALSELHGHSLQLEAFPLEMPVLGTSADSTRAAQLLAELEAGCIITLGGDGTNRAVAQGCGTVPLVPISTGTNNVFPTMIDGTIAGLAAGLFAMGAVDRDAACRQTKRVEVVTAGGDDCALIDAAVCLDHVTGARAVWDPRRVRAVVMARADPWAVGLSSIGGRLCGVSDDDPLGLYVELGRGPLVTCVLAPGLVVEVPIAGWRTLALDEEVALDVGHGTIALDGERQLSGGGAARVRGTRAAPPPL